MLGNVEDFTLKDLIQVIPRCYAPMPHPPRKVGGGWGLSRALAPSRKAICLVWGICVVVI